MAVTTVPLPVRAASRHWGVAQAAGVALTLVLVAALVIRPSLALRVLWNMVVPLLPAVFLVNPMLWRNACPLATLNSISGSIGRRSLGGRSAQVAWSAGIVLLLVMVPARRFLFNTDGPALAFTIGVVALLAASAGLFFSGRAGFCNALCPVLPVEKLYGQSPLIQVGNARCSGCSLCVPLGCIDLAGEKTVAQTLGVARKSRSWVTTPFGIFAAGFPGFIIAYFTVADGPLSSALATYGRVALYAALSYAAVAGLAFIADGASRTLLLLIAATSFALYYWWSAVTLGAAYGVPDVGPVVIRAMAGALLALWLWRAWRRPGSAFRRDVRLVGTR